MSTYTPTIGIEVHAELKTKSKMFCSCKNDPHASHPNTNICPVCLAHPGTLPVVNNEAVKKVLLVGRAISGEIASYSEFDRKNYFYPDIPKAYQLSQYQFPFVKGGELAGVSITRVHLEEDTARSQHQGEISLVDFNRAGVPLMELVTEPVIHSAAEAARFAKELQLLLRALGVSDANMEKGEMRVEANISISDSEKLGTKVEVKNLNSFKAVEDAINYEIERQKTALQSHKIITQETRGWNTAQNKTFLQRSKETAEDYRYFPDPDIPKYDLSTIEEFNNSRLDEDLSEIPSKTRVFLQDLGIESQQAEALVNDQLALAFFKKVVVLLQESGKDKTVIKIAANYITSDLAGLRQDHPEHVLDSTNAMSFATLIQMVSEGEITSRVAKDLLFAIVFEGADPKEMAKEKGLLADNSVETLTAIVDEIISLNPTVVTEYKNGKTASLQFLLGQGMKATRGAANPKLLTELFEKKLLG
ncbi:glutaminyl-tRNA synthase (glutamine-hydrolyzing) subunit B [Candidatus Kaiserbacteria bacterium RIFOXYB1_FULL_46_14]|uniref:Aspartyl/glutamyl-tRNA(Asn/Gln) amidotransferase subunit B n=1 Tax=Candidatus Kaiserbacteria bacterium RIFOXYB1_FULL_46_14 TaxID=1798531 RepID=A0A1F6FHW3_9BACT|nr:MAG: glutaminyl-tRNA synthase (glutamine-hydrolyzing) subunit B [Candidatus Kaiserbacteria bacterium RIFOXYB1_FULL_46_14]